jgi:acyl carrier protein
MNSLKNTIREFVVENFLFDDNGDLGDNTSFLENGIIDSTGILELVAFIEETYGITVKDEELIPENLDSIDNVVQYVHSKNIINRI